MSEYGVAVGSEYFRDNYVEFAVACKLYIRAKISIKLYLLIPATFTF